jgi:hypothetical protein
MMPASANKRSFTSFVRPLVTAVPPQSASVPNADPAATLASPAELTGTLPQPEQGIAATRYSSDGRNSAGQGGEAPERTRVVTATGRVRTYTASRHMPGVTLRLTEDRWERLKMLSIQERRPIQEILGEALDAYIRGRGLRW